ncbi:MAG: hypothetical protein SGPRY_010107 [Prymnesium sp.]
MPSSLASPRVALSSGGSMPLIGFGTWGLKPRDVPSALLAALRAGYRLFDLSPLYANEGKIGEVLARAMADSEGAIRRSDLFLTSKAPPLVACDREALLHAFRKTLRDLQTDYLDLYLVHWPFCVRNGSPT